MSTDPNYCPGCEPDGFYAHIATCPNLVDVEVSTEGARHVSAGELRERAVLEANKAMGPREQPGPGEWSVDDETLLMWRNNAPPPNPAIGLVAAVEEHDAAGSEYLRNAKAPTLEGMLTAMGIRLRVEPALAPLDVSAGPLCSAETRVKRNLHNHTHRCQKLDGHEGGHEWKDGAGRTIIWYGEAKPLPTDMRYRFGLDPHWMMARPGRKTMANDFDSEW